MRVSRQALQAGCLDYRMGSDPASRVTHTQLLLFQVTAQHGERTSEETTRVVSRLPVSHIGKLPPLGEPGCDVCCVAVPAAAHNAPNVLSKLVNCVAVPAAAPYLSRPLLSHGKSTHACMHAPLHSRLPPRTHTPNITERVWCGGVGGAMLAPAQRNANTCCGFHHCALCTMETHGQRCH
jgi:hypothetical protein